MKLRHQCTTYIILFVLIIGLLMVAWVVVPADADAHRRKRKVHRYQPHHTSVWEDLDHCESTHGQGSPNRFQFTVGTWRSMPGRGGFPGEHTYEEQLVSAQQLVQRSGWGQFPDCSLALGMR